MFLIFLIHFFSYLIHIEFFNVLDLGLSYKIVILYIQVLSH